jgi:hypothetical protein
LLLRPCSLVNSLPLPLSRNDWITKFSAVRCEHSTAAIESFVTVVVAIGACLNGCFGWSEPFAFVFSVTREALDSCFFMRWYSR